MWACGVMVSTRDSESLNPGSNPGRPFENILKKNKWFGSSIERACACHFGDTNQNYFFARGSAFSIL
jgi:hypothetical protein